MRKLTGRHRSKRLAHSADARRASNGFKRIEQLSDPPVSGVNAVGGDILPNIMEVDARIGTAFRHYPGPGT